jgi:hypothetical protein
MRAATIALITRTVGEAERKPTKIDSLSLRQNVRDQRAAGVGIAPTKKRTTTSPVHPMVRRSLFARVGCGRQSIGQVVPDAFIRLTSNEVAFGTARQGDDLYRRVAESNCSGIRVPPNIYEFL